MKLRLQWLEVPIPLSYSTSLMLACAQPIAASIRNAHLFLSSPPRRRRRSHEWDAGKAVTFIVTLAATRSVTLAAREAGMSRKSAYALRDRDTAFAKAWAAALGTRKGDKVEEVEEPPVASSRGDTRTAKRDRHLRRRAAEDRRDLFFARLAARTGRTRPLRQMSLSGDTFPDFFPPR